MPYIPLKDFIEHARSWPKKVKPIDSPSISDPKLHYADVIVQLDYRQATSMLFHEFKYPLNAEWPVNEGYGSFGIYFDVTINAFSTDSQDVQFSTRYGGLEAENRLQAYNNRFNKPVSSKAIKKIVKWRKISDRWEKRYYFDRVFFNNFPDDDTYWNFSAEEVARKRAANKGYLSPQISFKVDKKVIKNYTNDFKTSPLYPLYLWTADSIDEIMNNTDWQNQRVKRIREWARSYEPDKTKISLINKDFWETGNFSNDATLRRLHKLMVAEINSLKNKEKEKLIDPALGELGELARDTIRQEDKKRQRDAVTGGIVDGIAFIAIQLLYAALMVSGAGIW